MSATTTDIYADLDRLRFSHAAFTPAGLAKLADTKATPKPKVLVKKIAGEFVKGPIPLPWLTAVTKLSGKAPLAVALAIWFEAGRRKRLNELKLTTAILERFNVNRKAKYTALKSLEKAGLVRVRREPRRNPVVTILDVKGEPGAGVSSQGVAPLTAAPEQQPSLGDEQNGGT